MHSFTLLSKIRRVPNTVPTLVCSAYPGLRQDADLHLYNVSAFIEKPVNIETLEARVKELIE
jgi:response regulator RpfG family c-di-GMP phosphodiesterase